MHRSLLHGSCFTRNWKDTEEKVVYLTICLLIIPLAWTSMGRADTKSMSLLCWEGWRICGSFSVNLFWGNEIRQRNVYHFINLSCQKTSRTIIFFSRSTVWSLQPPPTKLLPQYNHVPCSLIFSHSNPHTGTTYAKSFTFFHAKPFLPFLSYVHINL